MLNTFQQSPHAMLPRSDHDARARQEYFKMMRGFVQTRILPGVPQVCEERTLDAFQAEHGRAADNRRDFRRTMRQDSYFQMYAATMRITQELLWISVQEAIEEDLPRMHAKASELRDDAAPPANAPEFETPRYITALDIHCMPGGYAPDHGDYSFAAGALYDRGAWLFGMGRGGPLGDDKGRSLANYIAATFPDLKPLRVLDMGCTAGASTLPYKEVFPEAQVIGIDVAGPMVEYARLRAAAMEVDAEFEQRSAEDTGYADESFDLVVSHILLHETSGKAMPRIFNECHRLLKPGGYMIHADVPAFAAKSLFAQCLLDFDTYYNNEPFWGAMREIDQTQLAVEAGFEPQHVQQSVAPTALAEFADAFPGYTKENVAQVTTRKTALGEYPIGWDILIAQKTAAGS